MTKKNFKLILVTLCFSTLVLGQNKTPTPTTEQQKEDEDIIRISSQLVLVDTLVLDKKGRQVTGLSADDFEIYQDGKLQKITNFAYVNSGKNPVADSSPFKNKIDKKVVPLPPVSVRSGGEGRIITFVIDDCAASLNGIVVARDGIRKFIDEQMLSDDKVAIYRTRPGSVLLQAYTSNREVLKRIIDKVNLIPLRDENAPDEAKEDGITAGTSPVNEITSRNFSGRENRQNENNAAEEGRIDCFKRNTGVLSFVADRLKNVPARKIIFFISSGLPDIFATNYLDDLKQVADKAARSSAVIYTMSGRGLTIPGLIEAADDVPNEASRDRLRASQSRTFNEGLAYLADSTGGKFIFNKNFLNVEMKKILEAETGFYTLGYQPDDETFKGKKYHKIEVKLKRPDLVINSRKEFYGLDDIKTQKNPKSSETPMYQAISAPFQEKGINVRLTTLAGNDAKQGDYIRAFLHIKGEDLTFTDEADGTKKVILDVVAVALDERGKVIEEFNRTYPIRIPKQGFQTILQNGLDYSTDMPVKKSGFYSFRIAVRDNNSKRLGSAGDFVEISDTKKSKFFMSGLFTTAVTNESKPLLPKNRPAEAAFAPVFFNSIPSIRHYYAGSVLSYVYNIYNSKPDEATKQPKLTRQIRLYKDGKLLADETEKPIEVQSQSDISRIQDYGFLRLNEKAEKGEYILQIIIRDKLANRTTSQWIDFEVVK